MVPRELKGWLPSYKKRLAQLQGVSDELKMSQISKLGLGTGGLGVF